MPVETPKAILMISGHWEEGVPRFSGAEQPGLLFDYYGFPPHTYELTWPAPGAPWLAERGAELLAAAGLPAGIHPSRGYDHGGVRADEGRLPRSRDPDRADVAGGRARPGAAYRRGQGARPLRDEGVLVLGSGMSFHNLRA